MPQARLPDINHAYMTYRSSIIRSIGQKNYDMAFGSLLALQALMPKTVENGGYKYRVAMNNDRNQELLAANRYLKCQNDKCGEENPYTKVQFFDALKPEADRIFSEAEYEKWWICFKCKTHQKFTDEHVIMTEQLMPFFTGVVSEPPKYRPGVGSYKDYERKFVKWIMNALAEVEGKLAEYRDDNWKREDVDDDDGVIDGGEDDE